MVNVSCRSAVTTLRPEIGKVMYEDHKQVREADEVTSSLFVRVNIFLHLIGSFSRLSSGLSILSVLSPLIGSI